MIIPLGFLELLLNLGSHNAVSDGTKGALYACGLNHIIPASLWRCPSVGRSFHFTNFCGQVYVVVLDACLRTPRSQDDAGCW